MKTPILILMLTACLGPVGCSSLGGLLALDQAAYREANNYSLHPVHLQLEQNDVKSYEVFNNNPYALHLEIEEAAPDSSQAPVRGDGGASLNAYAACLTLKVMF